MRPLVGFLLAPALLASGCDAPQKGPDDGDLDAACDSQTEECRGGRGQRSTGQPLADNQFGIAASFPEDAWVCPSFSWDNVRGYYTVVGRQEFDCLEGGDAETFYGIYADWNATFWTERRLLFHERECEPFGGTPTAVDGLTASECSAVVEGGRRELAISVVGGSQPGVDGGPPTPLISYTLYLVSSDATWERDVALFRQFVDHLDLTPPTHLDTPLAAE